MLKELSKPILLYICNILQIAEKIVIIENLETIQFINNTKKIQKPLKIFLFLIKNEEFLQNLKVYSKDQYLEIIRNFSFFAYENRFFLLIPPEIIEITSGEITPKILVRYNRNTLIGIGIIVASFDGTYCCSYFIPGNIQNIKEPHLLFIIEDDHINLNYGILSSWQKKNILDKLKK
jgi:hypothetical protein